jgi:hypothetical protein
MKRDDYFTMSKRYLVLQVKYFKLKEEPEKFLKKKSGYKGLRELMKEISSYLSSHEIFSGRGWGYDEKTDAALFQCPARLLSIN